MQRYLDSEDELTGHTVNMMEEALERFYQVEEPWFLAAHCTGTEEAKNLKVEYFYIDREIPKRAR